MKHRKSFILGLLLSLSMVACSLIGFVPGTVSTVMAAEKEIAVGTTYNIGDTVKLNEQKTIHLGRYYVWVQSGDYLVPEPEFDYTNKKWCFKNIFGSQNTLELGEDSMTGTEVITGIKCNGGDGTWEEDTATATPFTFELVKGEGAVYPLWVGGTRVTSKNCNNISTNHWSFTPESEDTPATLTLKGYSYDGEGYNQCGIYYIGDDPLLINFSGNNSIAVNDENCSGIDAKSVAFQGTSEASLTLYAKGKATDSPNNIRTYGIHTETINVTGGTVIFKGGISSRKYDYGISSKISEITVTGGKLIAIGGTGADWSTAFEAGADPAAALPDSDIKIEAGSKLDGSDKAECSKNDLANKKYVEITSTKKPSAVVIDKPKARDLIYNGAEQELVTSGTAENGTMNYALGKDTETAPTEGWSAAIPKETKAGTYYVWYKAKGNSNYSDSKPGVVSVTIKEKTAAHTHEIKHVDAKEPTCEEDGYEAHYECTVEGCGEWFEDDTKCVPIDKEKFIKKATGHKWDKGVVTQEATYDETGIKTYTCTKCNATRDEIIPRKTRSYSDSSDSSSDSDGGGSGSSGNKSGNISTRSIDINGNVIQTQADSGAPVSDRGGNWGNENLSWTYTKSDGNLAKSEWLNLEYNGHTYWYYFDDSTIMQTDWFNYNGATYYFVPEMDGWRGRMATGWQQIGDKWYYFEPTLGASQGQMYRGAMTPDGHVVGADGAWDGNGTAPVSYALTGTTVSGN